MIALAVKLFISSPESLVIAIIAVMTGCTNGILAIVATTFHWLYFCGQLLQDSLAPLHHATVFLRLTQTFADTQPTGPQVSVSVTVRTTTGSKDPEGFHGNGRGAKCACVPRDQTADMNIPRLAADLRQGGLGGSRGDEAMGCQAPFGSLTSPGSDPNPSCALLLFGSRSFARAPAQISNAPRRANCSPIQNLRHHLHATKEAKVWIGLSRISL